MAWKGGTIAMVAGLMTAFGGGCCRHCYSQDASEFLVQTTRGEPTANIYPLDSAPLKANAGTYENSQNNRLVRIRGTAPDGQPREFDVFFGPCESDLPTKQPGRGRFQNADPTWQNVQGYAIMRGIRPSGSTQYVKATSNSTTIITLVDKTTDEERILVTEGHGAYVHLANQPPPIAPNLMKGQVIVVKIENGVATLQPAVDYSTDKVSVDLLAYLERWRGVQDIGFK